MSGTGDAETLNPCTNHGLLDVFMVKSDRAELPGALGDHEQCNQYDAQSVG
jgi:hypothetical protein